MCTCDINTCTFCHMSNGMWVMVHIWHSDIVKKQSHWKTKPSQKRNIFCHLCNKQYAFMFWKNCIYVISIVNFISVHSVYMNLLYIRILTMNKVQRAIKHVCVTYFYIFMEMPPKFATDCLEGGYIWWLCHKCHLNMWTPISGGISDGHCLKIWTHFRFYSCFTEVFSMKDQWMKVVPWCSNILDCWWKDMSKLVRGRNSPHSIFIDLVQEYVIKWCMYIFVNSDCK